MAKKVGVLCRLRNILSINAKICIYNTIVRPHLNYCATILYMASGRAINRLQILQNRAIRCILNCNRYTSIKKMLNKLEWLNVRNGLLLNVLVFIFKLDKGLLPKYFSEYMVRNKDIHNYNTRNKDKLRSKLAKKCNNRRGLLHGGIEEYNRLPDIIRQSKNVDSFVKYLKKYLCK